MKKTKFIIISFAALMIAGACSECSTEKLAKSPVVINEMAAHGEYSDDECWIELANAGTEEESLDGMTLILSNKYFNGKQIWKGAGTILPGERLLLSVAEGTLSVGFGSDEAFVIELCNSRGKACDRFRRDVEAGGKALCRGGSWQRMPDISGGWKAMTYATPGHENKAFRLEDYKNNAIWMWSAHVPEWMADDARILREMKAKGYDHVLLNYYGFDKKPEETREFVRRCHEEGINVHAWIQCFHNYDGWVSPVDDENKCYKEELYADILAHARTYVEEFGVKGLHMDYIRFGGTAYKHNPAPGVTAVGAIVKLCKEMRELADSYDEGIVLSAAMMTDDNDSFYYYGQNQYLMAKYIDIFMPMIYRFQENGGAYGEQWCHDAANKFTVDVEGNISQCWAGLQTYNYPRGSQVAGLDEARLLDECRIFSHDCGARGVVLFRYGLGTFPDVNDLWN